MARTNPAMTTDTSNQNHTNEKPTPVTMGFCDENLAFRLSKRSWINRRFNSCSLRWQKWIISVVFFWQSFFPNLKYYLIPILSFVSIPCFILLIFLYRTKISNTGLNDCATVLAILTALITAWQFICRRKMETLQKLNERFLETPSCQVVIKHLISEEKGSSEEKRPDEKDIEIFYRFFEELELAIRKGVVSSKNAFDLFAYYAMIGLYLPDRLLPEYPESEFWVLLQSFERRMSTKYKFYYTLTYKQSHKHKHNTNSK